MTTPVSLVEGHVFVMPRDDIDTDAIYPAKFLKTTGREGLKACLFADWVADGNPVASFVSASKKARVLVAGENFGCGSSREHAVWALADFGIQAVLAKSFGDIFRNNCAQNSIVAATLSAADHMALVEALAMMVAPWVSIDVAAQTVGLRQATLALEFAPGHVQKLLSGEDDIDRTLHQKAALAIHEEKVARAQPWLTQAQWR